MGTIIADLMTKLNKNGSVDIFVLVSKGATGLHTSHWSSKMKHRKYPEAIILYSTVEALSLYV